MGTGSFRDGNKSGREEFGSRGGRGNRGTGINDPDRPRTGNTIGAGSNGGRGGGGEGEPTKEEPGLFEQVEDSMARLDKEFRAAIGADPFQESFRPDPRRPNDERPRAIGLLRPAPPPEDEAILPGDPNDLGARARRRRNRNDSNASPVLRRGLLGV